MRNRFTLALALLVAVSAAPRLARAEDSDPWWGKDKALHFGISTGIAAGTYAGSTLVFDKRWQRATTAAGVTITIGAAKEGWDAMGHGDPSFKDFTWDVAGAAVGTGLALLIDLALGSHRSSPDAATAR